MSVLTGGCLCGAVRYTAEVETVRTGICHCRNCQKTSGSAFSVNLFLPAAELQVSGEVQSYADAATASGRTVTRRFCPRCGSSLFSETVAFPGVVIVKGGSLDDTSRVAPDLQVWASSKQAWLTVTPSIPALPKGRT